MDREDQEEADIIVKEFFSRCDVQYKDSLDRLVAILDQAQSNSGGNRLFTWFRDVSGVTKKFGIVKGTTRNRNTWAYVMSNDLLWTLVHLATIQPDNLNKDHPDRYSAR